MHVCPEGQQTLPHTRSGVQHWPLTQLSPAPQQLLPQATWSSPPQQRLLEESTHTPPVWQQAFPHTLWGAQQPPFAVHAVSPSPQHVPLQEFRPAGQQVPVDAKHWSAMPFV